MKNIMTIFTKQMKDTAKNKTILIQFILFPLMTIIMEKAVKLENMPEHFFLTLFTTMYIGMAPLTCSAAIIAEEKEKGTLRALLMSNVKAWEYLIGVCSYVFLLCMTGCFVMTRLGGLGMKDCAIYMAASGLGILMSSVIGLAIGMMSANQMAATSLVMPIMMVLSFAPMLANFNDIIRKFAQILYTEQIYAFIISLKCDMLGMKQIGIMSLNFILAAVSFGISYKRGFK